MKPKTILLAAVASICVTASSYAITPILVGTEFSNFTDLSELNQTTGALTSIAPSGVNGIGDLTSDTRSGSATIWGNRIDSNELFSFDAITGAASLVAAMNSADSIVSLAFDVVSGKLYGNSALGFSGSVDKLYEIDTTTGNTTLIGTIGFDNVYALAFDQLGRLFGVSDSTDELISINTATGAGSSIGATGLGSIYDIASNPDNGTMFAADSGTNSLYTIDTNTGATTLVGGYGKSANVAGLAFTEGSTRVPDSGTTAALLGVGLVALVGIRRKLH